MQHDTIIIAQRWADRNRFENHLARSMKQILKISLNQVWPFGKSETTFSIDGGAWFSFWNFCNFFMRNPRGHPVKLCSTFGNVCVHLHVYHIAISIFLSKTSNIFRFLPILVNGSSIGVGRYFQRRFVLLDEHNTRLMFEVHSNS